MNRAAVKRMEMSELTELLESVVSAILDRVDEERESKDNITKAFDELTEEADVYQMRAQRLRQGCEKALTEIREHRVVRATEVLEYALETARKYGEED